MKKYILLLACVIAHHVHIVGMELSLPTGDKFMPQLFKAIENQQNDEVKRIVAQNPTLVNAYHSYEDPRALYPLNASGATPLHVAVYKSNTPCVQFLLESGANSNAMVKRGSGGISLHLVNDRKIAELLMQHGAIVDQKDSYGTTPLYRALFTHHYFDLADCLIEKGADVNQRVDDNKNSTLLHEAVWGGLCFIVEFLLEHRADRTLRNNEGKTPLDLAELRHITILLRY